MKIEHWEPQNPATQSSSRQLDYSNLLGSCKGGESQPLEEQHCDTKKANAALSVNPADPAHQVEDRTWFSADGSIHSNEALLDQELSQVLNLNLPWMRRNRKSALQAFLQKIPQRYNGRQISRETWMKWLDAYSSGELPEYSQVIVYYIRKKL